jgi:DNA polymerase
MATQAGEQRSGDGGRPLVRKAIEREQALEELRREGRGWRGCPLGETATQLVLGDGPATATLMFIGEAPGYHEDKQGVPFVGPAGRLLNEGLAKAGIDREAVYVTNVEKFRPWIPVGGGSSGRPAAGKNRQPKQSEINACRPWLEREIAIVEPQIICCLGAVAARWVLGKEFRLTQQRGEWLPSPYAPSVLATLHPAYVLIQPDASRAAIEETFFGDLRRVAERYQSLRPAA